MGMWIPVVLHSTLSSHWKKRCVVVSLYSSRAAHVKIIFAWSWSLASFSVCWPLILFSSEPHRSACACGGVVFELSATSRGVSSLGSFSLLSRTVVTTQLLNCLISHTVECHCPQRRDKSDYYCGLDNGSWHCCSWNVSLQSPCSLYVHFQSVLSLTLVVTGANFTRFWNCVRMWISKDAIKTHTNFLRLACECLPIFIPFHGHWNLSMLSAVCLSAACNVCVFEECDLASLVVLEDFKVAVWNRRAVLPLLRKGLLNNLGGNSVSQLWQEHLGLERFLANKLYRCFNCVTSCTV